MEKGDLMDVIIDSILDRGTEAPKFVRDCEKKVVLEIHRYTDRIRLAGAEKLEGGEEALLKKEHAEGLWDLLLDSVCDANRIYMKKGVQVGAKIVFELLGL